MNDSEYLKLIVLKLAMQAAAKDYPGKTIENVIVQIEARIKEFEQINNLNYEKDKGNTTKCTNANTEID